MNLVGIITVIVVSYALACIIVQKCNSITRKDIDETKVKVRTWPKSERGERVVITLFIFSIIILSWLIISLI